jgi:hypothetical protein
MAKSDFISLWATGLSTNAVVLVPTFHVGMQYLTLERPGLRSHARTWQREIWLIVNPPKSYP